MIKGWFHLRSGRGPDACDGGLIRPGGRVWRRIIGWNDDEEEIENGGTWIKNIQNKNVYGIVLNGRTLILF